ncbi:MAG: caspase family protein [Dehalococcoidia bacterium]|nr:caspase family protein [Dehalococcoidia bacterium]
MRKVKILGVIISVLLVVSLVLPVVAYAGDSHSKHPKVRATKVEIVKKVTLKDLSSLDKQLVGEAYPDGVQAGKWGSSATGRIGKRVTGERYAIVIGIADYADDNYDLKYCDADADEMRSTLEDCYGFNFANIRMLLNGAATRDAVLNTIAEIKGLEQRKDEVVFFFSGHGVTGIADDGDWELFDEAILTHDMDYIWDGELKDAFRGFDTSRITFVFDCCKSGGMNDLDKFGRVICMATTELGFSFELDCLGHGIFTYYMVQQGMHAGQADLHWADGVVTVEEAFDYARSHAWFQLPQIEDSFRWDLLL